MQVSILVVRVENRGKTPDSMWGRKKSLLARRVAPHVRLTHHNLYPQIGSSFGRVEFASVRYLLRSDRAGPVGSGFVCLVRSAYTLFFCQGGATGSDIVHNGHGRRCVAAEEQGIAEV